MTVTTEQRRMLVTQRNLLANLAINGVEIGLKGVDLAAEAIGEAELLAMQKLPEAGREQLQEIRAAALQMEQIVNTLLALAHEAPKTAQRQLVMLLPILERAVAQARHASGRDVNTELYRLAMDKVRQAHEAGVQIVAGTDAGDTYVFPGFAIHDELAELVRAGLSPSDALRSATIVAARFTGQARDYGSIEWVRPPTWYCLTPTRSPISAVPEELRVNSSMGNTCIVPRWTNCWHLRRTRRVAFAPTSTLFGVRCASR